MALQVIGTDGGLLPAAVTRGYVMLMPGERVNVWADFGALAGKQVILRSLSFDAGGMEAGFNGRVTLESSCTPLSSSLQSLYRHKPQPNNLTVREAVF